MTKAARRHSAAAMRRRVHSLLESGLVADKMAQLVHRGLILVTLVSVVSLVLESAPELTPRFGRLFLWIEAATVAIFTLEYGLRVWSAPDHTPFARKHPLAARLAFMRTGAAVIDLLSIAPFYVSLFAAADPGVLLLFRLLRFFKLSRYSPGMTSLIAALEAERKALFASAVILMGVILVAAAAMHIAEQAAQPDKFGSIPLAMWWAVVTLTTVGYGDVIPATLLGRVIAGATMIVGLMMLALPVGIIATSFANEIHRREFIINWALISRVPLFAMLEAAEIAEIMPFLHARTLQPGAVIFRRGDVAHSMYFIASGEVEVDLPNNRVRLGEGQLFGEIAVLRRTRRSAGVRATKQTRLLVLEAADLHALIERNPDIGARIEAVAASRQAVDPADSKTAG